MTEVPRLGRVDDRVVGYAEAGVGPSAPHSPGRDDGCPRVALPLVLGAVATGGRRPAALVALAVPLRGAARTPGARRDAAAAA
ncbi:hypothetical protein G5V59_26885 [Nocardioides sp. W3-2-3]|uniref:hypothetical protein n=1 Tax=Nocardioides convexus TaxID=2712224 RepID=UPI002418A771|nr:hypothetical protein [Nocardioides convexus]NHA02019.1 hypothetical protein [Nocardioides convexus]